MTGATPLLAVDRVSVSYHQGRTWQPTVEAVSFSLAPGETFGLAGESGSGKSTLVYQTLGYRPANARLDGGRILFKGENVLAMGEAALRRLRGNRISLVPQNPTTALSPGMRVGAQVAEVLAAHGAAAGEGAGERIAELFDLVGLPTPREIGRRYPHQLSGGQQQRVVIAMAIACSPDLLVLDEPTTGLDVTTQKQVLELLRSLRDRLGMAMLYVTHDLGVLAEIADRVGIMYAGRLVEVAPVADILGQPLHPYTRGLIASRPQMSDGGTLPVRFLRGVLRRAELPPGCAFAPRCEYAEAPCFSEPQSLDEAAPAHAVACRRWRVIARPALVAGAAADPAPAPARSDHLLELADVSIGYRQGRRLSPFGRPPVVVVEGLSLAIDRGETLAMVGESGSGKSTTARAIAGLVPPLAGRISYQGEALAGSIRDRPMRLRREIQYVFQNPDASLNPRMTVRGILARPREVFFKADGAEIERRIAQVLDDVRLDSSYAARYPDELSGGERQRIAIARAIMAEPTLMLCDEILSALDVSVQASVIELLRRLRQEHSLALLFISHDLAVVRSLADRVAVLFRGRLVELGTAADVFAPPYHPYTESLLLAVPGVRARNSAPQGPAGPPPNAQGCPFAGRCPRQLGELCATTPPPWRATDGGLRIRCHIPLAELAAGAIASVDAAPPFSPPTHTVGTMVVQ
jgi:peptide/nickel transport system ATP-binding protein